MSYICHIYVIYIYICHIYVTPSDKFKIKFRDIFSDTVICHRSSAESRRWLAGPNFEYYPSNSISPFFAQRLAAG